MAKTTFNPDNPAFATPDGAMIFEKFEYSAGVGTLFQGPVGRVHPPEARRCVGPGI